MEIVDIREKSVWENFLFGIQNKTFLQSWNWGEFQKMMGNKIWRIGIYDSDKLIGVALVTKLVAKRGTFLLIQHGPVGDNFGVLFEELKKIARQEKVSFIRVAPLAVRNTRNEKMFIDLGFHTAPMHANAYEATWKLSLSPSEDDLLAKMRKTTRYLVRQTMKNPEITLEKSDKSDDIEIYQNLHKEVARRQKFVSVSKEYLRNEFEVFKKDDNALLFFGKHKGEVAAGALVIFWSGIGFYHQAASLEKYAKFSIPYLLQWSAIKEAKKRGCKMYDFWGYVDPQKYPNHPWAGPTLFKMGFGGEPHLYVKTQDLPLSWKYWPIYIFEKLRKTKRGL